MSQSKAAQGDEAEGIPKWRARIILETSDTLHGYTCAPPGSQFETAPEARQRR